MMQITKNVEAAMELLKSAADASRMTRLVYIENARIVISDFDKKDWSCLIKLVADLNAVQFNMLVSVGIKKPYRADIFRNRLGNWK